MRGKLRTVGRIFLAIALGSFLSRFPLRTEAEEGILVTDSVLADENQLEELKARLETLERHNEQLQKALDSQRNTNVQQNREAEATGYKVGTELSFQAYWRDGLIFETPNKDFRFHVGGRMQQDWGWGHPDQAIERDLGDILDGANYRRLRLKGDGSAYEIMEYVVEMDFAGGTAQPRDVFLEFTHLPLVGHIRAGHFKEPFSLDQLTLDNFIPFLERSLMDDAFVPGRRLGVMLTDDRLDQRLTWALGFFRAEEVPDGSDFGDGEYSYTGRVTGLPWYENEGRCLVHLGAAASHRAVTNDDVMPLRLRSRPELRAVRLLRGGAVREPFFVDTGDLGGANVQLFGFEAALVAGPVSLQAEYVYSLVNDVITVRDGVPHGDAAFQAYYVMASYFLTGENRFYRRPWGAFDRPRPFENFFWVQRGEDSCWRWCWGKGAWELLARHSWLDLNDAGIEGGILEDFTLGLTWYPNPNARVMWNYILADRNGPGTAGDGIAQLFGVRVQFDF